LRGTADGLGRPLEVTEVAVADELASAAELVMGKATGVAAAVIRGVDPAWFRDASVRAELVRPAARTCSGSGTRRSPHVRLAA
ncbi:MAG: coenzyme F420-0:L-glutamate ligase, partial [Acidimicrobiales bacterium]